VKPGRGAARARVFEERAEFSRLFDALLAADAAGIRDDLGLGDLATVDDGDDLASNARVAVEDDGTLVGARRRLNFYSTTLTITITDDGANERINVQVEGGAGSGLTEADVLARMAVRA